VRARGDWRLATGDRQAISTGRPARRLHEEDEDDEEEEERGSGIGGGWRG